MLRIRNAVVACLLMVTFVVPSGQALAAIDTSNLTFPNLQSVRGLDNPSLAYGLDGISDWSQEMPFIDIVKMGRPWSGVAESSLDENGWPTSGSATMIWDWSHSEYGGAESRAGRYVLTYDGSGNVSVGSGARTVSSASGQIVFDLDGSSALSLNINSTNSGDHVRNVSIVREDLVPLHEAGAIFNPDFIEIVKGARQVRFMDWMNTNNSDIETWDEWPHKDWYTWVDGAPVEVMVALANEIGADPWFTMPHKADDNFVRNFATYVEAYLNPDLQAYVELSNETWNGSFDQAAELRAMGQAVWTQGNTGEWGAYYVKRASDMVHIWEDVFGAEADDRVVAVLSGQTVNPNKTATYLAASTWRQNEPNTWSDPTETFDVFAFTSYFGGGAIQDSALMNRVMGMSQSAAFAALDEYMLDPSVKGSIPDTIANLREQKAVLEPHGIDLMLYEGGQHVHHAAFIQIAGDEAAVEEFMTNYVRSQNMANLYQRLWDEWESIGDGPFMQFVDVGAPSKWGSWGLRASLFDSTPRSELVDALNASTPAWFAGGGEHYQEGFIIPGTTGDNTLAGTIGVDTFVAGSGEDILYPGPGNDYINGGADEDVVMLRGAKSEYSVRNEGDGYRVVGPDGSDYMYAVEILYFEDGSTQNLSGSVSLGSEPVTVAAGNTNVVGTSVPGTTNSTTNTSNTNSTTNTNTSGKSVVTTDNVNLRESPGGDVVTVFPAGTYATIPSWNTPREQGGHQWSMVFADGVWGYVATEYLVETDEMQAADRFSSIMTLIQLLLQRLAEIQAQLDVIQGS